MDTVKNIQSIKPAVVGQPQENPVSDIREKLNEEMNMYNKVLDEINTVFKQNNVKPIQQFRLAQEIQTAALEGIVYNIGNYIDDKLNQTPDESTNI